MLTVGKGNWAMLMIGDDRCYTVDTAEGGFCEVCRYTSQQTERRV